MLMKSFVLYVPNKTSNTVSVIDTINQILLTTIPVGNSPSQTIISPDGKFVICCNTDSNNISIINTTTNTIISTISVGNSPINGVFLPNSLSAFIINRDDNSIYKINLNSMAVDSILILDFRPIRLTLTKDGGLLYVAGLNSNNIIVINTDTNKIINKIQLPSLENYVPIALKLTPDEKILFYCSSSSPMLAAIDTSTNKIVEPVYYSTAQTFIPQDFVISNDGKYAYLIGISKTAGLVTRVSTSLPLKLVTSKFVFSIPYKAAITNNNKYLITSNTTSRNIFIFDIDNINNYTPIYTGGSPSDITVSTEKPEIYIVNKGLKEITSINVETKSIFTNYPVGENPSITCGGIVNVPVPSSLITKRPLKALIKNINLTSSNPKITQNIILDKVLGNTKTVRGIVTDENNFPIKGASLYVINSDGHVFDIRSTDDNGSYSFSLVDNNDYYDIVVSSPDYHYSDKKRIILSETNENIDFSLTNDLISKQGVLSGIIMDSNSNPLSNSSINIYNIDVGIEVLVERGITNSFGYFYFPYIPFAPYILRLSKPGYLQNEILVVVNKEGQVSSIPIKLNLDPSNPQGEISGIVKNSDGIPISNASIELYITDGNKTYMLCDQLTGSNGDFKFTNLRYANYSIKSLSFIEEAPN